MGNVRPLRRPCEQHAAWARRWRTSWKAELQAGGAQLPCTVVNMSADGAGLSIDAAAVEGTVVSLILSGTDRIPARIVWRRYGAMGLCFLKRQPGVLALVANFAGTSALRQ